ncbi:hypothetical protein EDM59_00520 [Brevibacillus nitrificans]|uniref:Uncharacterized protein n=1 Tax=Brevibacillus nitrificans TaxID=651560 RepID=A0A3M8DS56_9BACL|nr:hypothetical protein [Brevibacillus nitrificans]RNB90902.1 hypothetical protein EDM59_00520 [Brevibacillus nitrificans]
MRSMYGVEIQIPAGKLPGFYAQVIHKIGDHVNVFDRDQLLFIVENEDERDKLEEVLRKPNMLKDVFPLLLMPSTAKIESLEDRGFISQNEHLYLYADRIAVFTLPENLGSEPDRWAAHEQLREHLVGQIPGSPAAPAPSYIIDSSLTELVEGIARAYQVSLQWIHREE